MKKAKPAPTLSDIRALFDDVMQTYPAAKQHFVAHPTDGYGKIVFISTNFKCDVVKVLRSDEIELTTGDIKSKHK